MNGKNIIHQPAFRPDGLMMCYIVETADDKLIVIDGGYHLDALPLLDYLKKLRGTDKVHVDTWLLTHDHNDHIDAFLELMDQDRCDLTVGDVYYNFPTAADVNTYEPTQDKAPERFEALYDRINAKVNLIKFEDGMKFSVGCAEFEVLYVPDYTIHQNYVNNTSSVFRMTLAGKTYMFLGDLGVEGGKVMLEKHGSYLKSDYVQMAHHGQNGVDRPVYEAIAPTGCFWDTPTWLWNNDGGKGWNSHFWKTVIVQGWMAELGVHEHYIAKDGPNVIEL